MTIYDCLPIRVDKSTEVKVAAFDLVLNQLPLLK